MSTSTNLTAEQLLELALRTSRACRERQRRVAARAEEERARLAALHGRIDELERENERLTRSCAAVEARASEDAAAAASMAAEASRTRKERDEARAAIHEAEERGMVRGLHHGQRGIWSDAYESAEAHAARICAQARVKGGE